MNRQILSLVLAAAGLMAASHGASAAQAMVQNGFSQIQIGLIDLTPNDSAAAAYSVASVSSYANHRLSPADGPSQYWKTSGTFPLSLENVSGSASASSQISAIADLDSAVGIASHPGKWESSYADTFQLVSFLLAPHSVLTFSGTYLSESTLVGDSSNPLFRTNVGISFSGPQLNDVFSKEYSTQQAESHEIPFWFAAANTGDTEIAISLRLETSAYASFGNEIPSIPEPSSYAMLLAGLCATVVFARRRR